MSRKSENYRKWAVILIGVLFLTSMAGVALDSSAGGQNAVELPDKFVLDAVPTDEQKALIYGNGGTLVVFVSDPFCGFECDDLRSRLESVANRYNGQYGTFVYLVFLEGEMSGNVTVENYFGSDELSFSEAGLVEDKVCEAIPGHPACIERSAIAAVMSGNGSANETADE